MRVFIEVGERKVKEFCGIFVEISVPPTMLCVHESGVYVVTGGRAERVPWGRCTQKKSRAAEENCRHHT